MTSLDHSVLSYEEREHILNVTRKSRNREQSLFSITKHNN